MTLPETGPGAVTVRLYSDDQCKNALGQPQSEDFAIKRVQANPTLSPKCDMRVALVLDESYSIYNTPSDHSGVTGVRNGAKAFVNGLVNTGAEVTVVEFNSQARTVSLGGKTYNPVDSAFVSGPFAQYINATAASGDTYDPAKYSSPNYYTNWQDAFVKLQPLQPEFVVYLTDGDPTARNIGSSPGFETSFANGSYSVFNPAFGAANALKSAGSHVFVIGVGAGLSSDNSKVRLRAISGQNQFPEHDLVGADYTLITDFSKLQEALAQIGHALCSVRVHVTKLVDDKGEGKYAADNGWEFSGEVTVSGGQSSDSYRWLSPGEEKGPPSGGNTRSAATTNTSAGDGRVDFTWLPFPTTLTSQIVLTDKGRDGYHFAGVTCTKNAQHLDVQSDSATGKVTITGLRINDDVKCDVKNQKDTGTLKVAKKFVGTPTEVSLLINGEKKKTSNEATFETESVTLPTGTHQVSEQFTDPDLAPLYDSSYLCKDARGGAVKSGQGTVVAEGVPVKAGDEVTCTFTNKKDTSVVVKKIPDPTAVDEPGGEVTFTVTVTNTSSVAATLTSLVDDVYGDLDLSSPADKHSWISSNCKTGGLLAAKDEVEGGGPDTYTCSFVGAVTATPAKAHEDTVRVIITDKSGEKATDSSTAIVNGRDLLPAIKVTKSADPTLLEGGGPVTYAAVIANTSAADTLKIDQLADSIYGNLISGLHKASCNYGDAKVDLPYDLPPGESLVCSFQVTVTTSQTDTITASGIDGEANRVTDSSDAIVTVTPPPTPTPPTPTPPTPTPPTPTPTPPTPEPTPPAPTPPAPAPEPTPPAPTPTPPPPGPPVIHLAVEKRAPAVAHLDVDGRAAFAFDIRVRNDGPALAPKATLRDAAPNGVRFSKITHQPSQVQCSIGNSGGVLTCTLGDLVPAQTVDIQVDVTVKGEGGARTTNTATASCQPEPTAPCKAEASATTRLIAPFKPPAVNRPGSEAAGKAAAAKARLTCRTVSTKPRTLIANSKRQTITVIVRNRRGTLPRAALLVKGPGILRVARVRPSGVSVVTVKPTRAGVLTIGVRGLRGCLIQKVGLARAAKTALTG